ncbi:Nramp family divalent metal transporter [Echinicola sp. CAU 1574]|uniref:Nramp family divalent metal transporter n=1 Tax=Echinicola arenosa TaxID=2774144 RepID=A0ABR9AP82_9BACT|nr:Nramp family divalent metal transporter [Echinicola arenosa]MBD8490525.1 Nramp family divalent metal transporter [Echinicola arenosa]
MKNSIRKYIGPGPLVAAAFIGPGTVTVCTLAGVNFGFDLLWALLLSVIATIVLQETAARIGLISQKGLTEIIRQEIGQPVARIISLVLVIMAIVIGNAAYEAGNIGGAVLGLEAFGTLPTFQLNSINISPFPLITGLLAWGLLMSGSYKKVEQFMVMVVILMSLVFLITASMSQPKFNDLLTGFVPNINGENIMTIVALIGTTVVPYNLFLHTSLVAKKWNTPADLKYARVDTVISVVLGGLVSMAILITGTLGEASNIQSVLDLSKSVEPLLGASSPYFLGVGLFAAGITSSITAPLAGALVVCGCFGWSSELSSKEMRWTFSVILFLGIIFSSLGIKPVQLITIAQLANGILLPVLSTFILWVINRKQLMGNFKNSLRWNILTFAIWIITWVLGIKSIISVI